MQTIAVIDYGASNLRSVSKALDRIADKHSRIVVSDDSKQIMAADKVVFPGQGAMGQCMRSLADKHLEEVLVQSIRTKPFLGICLGLQSLMDESDEDGATQGLGLISGRVNKFETGAVDVAGKPMKIPHMGWNRVNQKKPHALWQGISSGERFYFVHSYYVAPTERADVAASCDYVVDFCAAVARDNLFATQFHPEKSQQAGLTLLSNFLQWQP
jgi:imidazole glycerol-phosphate synthase subunit HisH